MKRRLAIAGVFALLLSTGCNWFRDFDYGRGARVANGDPQQGKAKLRKHSCTSCHIIPGIADADGTAGPALNRWGRRRSFLGGAVENSPENLERWMMDPASVKPGTRMPAMPMTEPDARDMAAYLFSINK